MSAEAWCAVARFAARVGQSNGEPLHDNNVRVRDLEALCEKLGLIGTTRCRMQIGSSAAE